MAITAYMMSCAERDAVREQTLRNLRDTDWGEPARIEMDRSTAARRQEHNEETARALLSRAIEEQAEFVLFLEDDLEFNRHLRHNLAVWLPLRQVLPGGHFFASLYNPNVHELSRDRAHAFFVADPEAVYGSQAMLLARVTAWHILDHWGEVPGMADIKMSRLAAQVGPIYYHVPSLVQHAQCPSVWGGTQHCAPDYGAHWKAAATRAILEKL